MIASKLKPLTSNTSVDSVEKQTVSHTYEKPTLRNIERKAVQTDTECEHVFQKPALRNIERPSGNLKNNVEKEHIFDKPALRRIDPVKKDTEIDQNGVFDKTVLRKTEVNHKTNDKSSFEKPVLRNVSQEWTTVQSGNKVEKDKPVWMTELKLKKTSSRENVSDQKLEVKELEKPLWLQSATKKRTKIAEFMKTKGLYKIVKFLIYKKRALIIDFGCVFLAMGK